MFYWCLHLYTPSPTFVSILSTGSISSCLYSFVEGCDCVMYVCVWLSAYVWVHGCGHVQKLTIATRYRLWHLSGSSAQAGSLAEPRPHRLSPVSTVLGLPQGHANLSSIGSVGMDSSPHASMVRTLSTEPSPESPSLLSINLSLKIFLHQDARAISEH